MMCLVSTNLVFADGTVDIHGTYSIHIGGYDWGSATDNKKAENNPSQAIKTGDTAHGEIYAMIMMFAAAGYFCIIHFLSKLFLTRNDHGILRYTCKKSLSPNGVATSTKFCRIK